MVNNPCVPQCQPNWETEKAHFRIHLTEFNFGTENKPQKLIITSLSKVFTWFVGNVLYSSVQFSDIVLRFFHDFSSRNFLWKLALHPNAVHLQLLAAIHLQSPINFALFKFKIGKEFLDILFCEKVTFCTITPNIKIVRKTLSRFIS